MSTQLEITRLYLAEADEHAPLTQEEAVELCKEARNDRRTRSILTKRCSRFVLEVATEYLGQGLELADLIGRTHLVLAAALRDYTEARGQFKDYVVACLRERVESVMWDESAFVRDTVRIAQLRMEVLELLRSIRADGQSEPSLSELAVRFSLCEWQMRFLLEAQGRAIMSKEELLAVLESPLTHKRAKDFAQRVVSMLIRDHEKRLFLARYGLDGNLQPRTEKQVARVCGMAQENVPGVVDRIWREINPNFSRVISEEISVITEEVLELSPADISGGISATALLSTVSAVYEVSVDDLVKHSRKQKLAFARHVAMYLLRKDLEFSFTKIAGILFRDHTTIIHGCGVIEAALQVDVGLRETINKIRALYQHIEVEPVEKSDSQRINSVIADMVIGLVAKAKDIPVDLLRSESRKEIHVRPRHIAMYLLHEDFGWAFNSISEVFGKTDGAASWAAHKKIARECDGDKTLPEVMAVVRSGYTLEPYPNLESLEASQSRLFPGQQPEVKLLFEGLSLKLERFLECLTAATPNERHRNMFKMLYGLDGSGEKRTLEYVAQQHGGLTRERIRQIVVAVWAKIRESDVSEIESADVLLQLLNEIRILNQLIGSS